jgi:hypothetical protein
MDIKKNSQVSKPETAQDKTATVKGAAIEEPVTAPENPPESVEGGKMELTINTVESRVSEMLKAGGGLRPLNEAIKLVDSERAVDFNEMPPECMGGSKHPRFRFVWVTLPDTTARAQQYQMYLNRNYGVCNKSTPESNFWTSFRKSNGRWKFHVDGTIRCQNQILMVNHQEVFEHMERKRRDISASRNENNRGIQNYGVDERDMPAALKGSKTGVSVEDDGTVTPRGAELEAAFASADAQDG